MKENDKQFENPIDKDKITETPHSLEYGHHVGSALVKPEDRGKLKSNALNAMDMQTDMQLNQIYEQMQLLASQAKKLTDRKKISEVIYSAEMRFQPLINHTYFVYQKEDKRILSLISPSQWGKSGSELIYIAEVRLLADHTWDLLHKNDDFEL